ncbi:MAG TPA: helix-turn-helix domain-containing protein [Patescibacteria group bacterium]
MTPQLYSVLHDIGLSEKEAKVYLAMLELGESSIIPIARHAGIKRTTVYNYLEDFTRLGLISITIRNGRRYYVANSPNRLRTMLRSRLEQVETIIPNLFSMWKEEEEKPSVQMFEGIDGLKRVFELSLECESKKIDVIPIESAGHVFVGPEYISRYIEKSREANITFRSLRVPSDKYENYRHFEPEEHDNRTIKVAPDWFTPQSYIQIYDNNVGIFSHAKEIPYALVITSQSYAHTQRLFFESIWQQSTPIREWLREKEKTE